MKKILFSILIFFCWWQCFAIGTEGGSIYYFENKDTKQIKYISNKLNKRGWFFDTAMTQYLNNKNIWDNNTFHKRNLEWVYCFLRDRHKYMTWWKINCSLLGAWAYTWNLNNIKIDSLKKFTINDITFLEKNIIYFEIFLIRFKFFFTFLWLNLIAFYWFAKILWSYFKKIDIYIISFFLYLFFDLFLYLVLGFWYLQVVGNTFWLFLYYPTVWVLKIVLTLRSIPVLIKHKYDKNILPSQEEFFWFIYIIIWLILILIHIRQDSSFFHDKIYIYTWLIFLCIYIILNFLFRMKKKEK